MARLTNDEIKNMTINEADAYTDEHPAEAWRFAKAHGAAAIKQTKKAAKNGFDRCSVSRTRSSRSTLITNKSRP